jgi:hypothetical protein
VPERERGADRAGGGAGGGGGDSVHCGADPGGVWGSEGGGVTETQRLLLIKGVAARVAMRHHSIGYTELIINETLNHLAESNLPQLEKYFSGIRAKYEAGSSYAMTHYVHAVQDHIGGILRSNEYRETKALRDRITELLRKNAYLAGELATLRDNAFKLCERWENSQQQGQILTALQLRQLLEATAPKGETA